MIIPTINEERSVGEVIGELPRSLKQKCEIIVVDSNSTDRTREVARARGARVVVENRRGYGRAFLSGANAAKGDIVVLIDGDGTYSLAELPAIIKPIVDGNADLVIGSRFDGKMERGSMPTINYLGNHLFVSITNLLFRTSVRDSHSGYRAISASSLRSLKLQCKGMEYATEMVVRAAQKRLRIASVPITYRRRSGSSKLHPFRDGARHMALILKLFLSRP